MIKYKNGIGYYRLKKDITTGEKLYYCDSTAFVENFIQLFGKTKPNNSIINGVLY